MMVDKPKAIVFYTYLPPWRIDVFNEMGKYYDLKIVFLNADWAGFTYNRELLLKKLNVEAVFWNNGFNIGTKPFRTGIYRMIEKYKPMVVFSHEYSPTSILLATFVRLRLFGFQLIITTSDNLRMAIGVSGLKKYFRSYVLSSAKGIVVYSENVKNWYKEYFPRLRVEICPNIQNPRTLLDHKRDFPPILAGYIDKFAISKPVILYVGRLEEVKGLDLLIQAYSDSLRNTHQLVLVGEGSQKKVLEALAKECQVEDLVIFPGYFDGVNLYAWYALAHFFVLPSRFEPFGAVINESLVFGCPVLASKYIGALDYIEEGVNGFVFDPLLKEEFIELLNKASSIFREANIDRPDLMKQSFDHYVKKFKEIYF